ncbi:hypothetical protein CGRA01v4_06549 [Colletotrichum graminicola]|nr:hypothetical protein CGRA01v4_06549 [Colletotrichum graminicola]
MGGEARCEMRWQDSPATHARRERIGPTHVQHASRAHAHTYIAKRSYRTHATAGLTARFRGRGPMPPTCDDGLRITTTSVGDAESSAADMFSCHSKDPELFARHF